VIRHIVRKLSWYFDNHAHKYFWQWDSDVAIANGIYILLTNKKKNKKKKKT